MIIKGELDRVLTHLRNKIRERGYTQLEVQTELGWGRSYISQLLTKQKALRVEQVLSILRVVGVDPGEFFGELFPPRAVAAPPPGVEAGTRAFAAASRDPDSVAQPVAVYDQAWTERERQSLGELRSLVRGLVDLLADKELIDLDDLTSAVRGSSAEARFEEPLRDREFKA